MAGSRKLIALPAAALRFRTRSDNIGEERGGVERNETKSRLV
jgi:hypothetical protein